MSDANDDVVDLLSHLTAINSRAPSDAPVAIGIDQSATHSAMFKIYMRNDGSTTYRLTVCKPKTKGVDRLREIGQWLERHLTPAPLVFGIEDYSLYSSGKKDGAEMGDGQHKQVNVNFSPMLGEIGGLCRWLGDKAGCRIITPTPTQVKKFATGKGNSSKEDVMLAARQFVPDYNFRSDDESDALFVANIALAIATGHQGDGVPQMQVLHALRHPEEAAERKAAQRQRARGTGHAPRLRAQDRAKQRPPKPSGPTGF